MVNLKYSLSFWLCFLFLSGQFLNAQGYSKMNVDLYRYLEETTPAKQELLNIPVLIKGDLNSIEALVEQYKGKYKYGIENIASVNLPMSAIHQLIKSPKVERIEAHRTPMQQLYFEDSSSYTSNNVRGAHEGWGDLPQGYKGEDIVVGIIDDGFYFNHPDFLKADGTTRVQYLWDQNSVHMPFLEPYFGYGAAWTAAQIDMGLCSQPENDHGTHVAGLAAGNGLAANKYIGVAPEADLIFVKALLASNWQAAFVDGLYYMFMKADELGKPCAINSSLGNYYGGHDGKDLYSQLIVNMLEEKPGRVFVQAGGNNRQVDFHIGTDVTPSGQYTWFEYNQGIAGHNFLIYTDTADFDQVDFSFQFIDGNSHLVKGSSPSYNIAQDITFNNSVGSLSDTLFYLAGYPVVLELYVSKYDGTYEIYFELQSNSSNDYLQFTTYGEGHYDGWNHPYWIGTSEAVMDGVGNGYVKPDNLQTIAGFWVCAEEVITVSAYQNRDSMVILNGDTALLNLGGADYPKYDLWYRSSIGPTRDGRQKPDLAAPGGAAMAAASEDRILNNYQYLDISGYHVANSGTSMAAPMVAGAAALYLQCRPYASQAEVRTALHNSARPDSFVFKRDGFTPNADWGYGKLDVYELMKECIIYGCTDTTAINYNPAAMVDDGSCLISPVTELPNDDSYLLVAPNPYTTTAKLHYRLPLPLQDAQLEVFDILGRDQWQQNISNPSGVIDLPKHFSPGVYWAVLRNHQQIAKTYKFIVH